MSGKLRTVNSRWEGLDLTQVKVIVTLKPSLLDAQGRVVRDALHSLGYGGVGEVRIGKYMELEMSVPEGAGSAAMDAQVREMCERLLANPVIENYRYEVVS
jgi:phosphoribosylformylglycinamidine synthase